MCHRKIRKSNFTWKIGWKNGSLFRLHIGEWMILKYILKELGCDCISWIHLAWVGDRCEVSVNPIMNLSSIK